MSGDDRREREQQKPAVQEPAISPQDLVNGLPAAIALGALAVYGVLIAAYSQFYSELGVRPTEVGLVFGPALGGIAGVAVILVVLVVLTFGFARLYLKFGTPPKWLRAKKRRGLYLLGIIVLAMSAFLLWASIEWANHEADVAKSGEPVEPFDPLGLELYGWRADLAKVTRIDSGTENGQVGDWRLREPLLYLGRSGSTLVLYETATQSSVHLPTSAYGVRTLNCETSHKNRHPDCSDG